MGQLTIIHIVRYYNTQTPKISLQVKYIQNQNCIFRPLSTLYGISLSNTQENIVPRTKDTEHGGILIPFSSLTSYTKVFIKSPLISYIISSLNPQNIPFEILHIKVSGKKVNPRHK